MVDSVTIRTQDLTFFDLLLNPVETNGSSKASHCEVLILVFFVMKIKYPRICNTAPLASSLALVVGKPLVIPSN
jgi:hypothetical protein